MSCESEEGMEVNVNVSWSCLVLVFGSMLMDLLEFGAWGTFFPSKTFAFGV